MKLLKSLAPLAAFLMSPMPMFLMVLMAVATVPIVPARAASTIVNESFDSYADTTALEAVWTADLGNGTSPTTGPKGILVPNTSAGLTSPNDDPPGIQGKAVNILDNINEYNGPNLGLMANLVPTESESIRLTGDIFDDIAGNKRDTIGLRNDTVPLSFGVFASNIIEMGFWNANAFDPFDPAPAPPTDTPSTGYAYRMALYGDRGSLPHEPNWQYFQLDPALDIKGGEAAGEAPIPDGLVTPLDIGQGWHQYSVTIGIDSITFSLDLFRDGKANTEATAGVGPNGVDASVTWDIAPANNATEPNPFDPFTSLRIGGASGVSGNNESVVDNILLELIDVVASGNNADFDGNNLVNGNDFLAWQLGHGILAPNATLADGDADGDLDVDADDLAIWQMQFGGPPPALSAVSAVPEPSSVALILLAVGAMSIAARRSKQIVA